MISITSDDTLDSTEIHFRILAGPGAGKTHWLAKHVMHLVKTSDRLHASSRIACISYTNVAVTELTAKLKDCGGFVESTTIHSFLYRNVVRPYVHLIKNDDGSPVVNHPRLDGHDVHRPYKRCVEQWLVSVGTTPGNVTRLTREFKPAVWAYLSGISWQPDPNWEWGPVLPSGQPPQFLPVKKLQNYKNFYWREGVLDHDDVLYFAYRILEENPLLREFLACRFPYVFVDEFQDTNPVQTQVLRWLAESGSTIGVIGDPVQSIFSFQGAQADAFTTFNLPGQTQYQIENNRRSSTQIIGFLNEIRKDGLEQEGLRQVDGAPVLLIVGSMAAALTRVRELVEPNDDTALLARGNKEVAILRNLGRDAGAEDWELLSKADFDRFSIIRRLASNIELARNGLFALAVDDLTKCITHRGGRIRKPIEFDGKINKASAQGLALSILEKALIFPETLSLKDGYNHICDAIADAVPGAKLPKISRGRCCVLAEGIPFNRLTRSVAIPEDTRGARTIHKAKGAEFNAVCVSLKGIVALSRCCSAATKNGEEERILYVGFSRAKNSLFIHCESELPSELSRRLSEMGVEIESLPL